MEGYLELSQECTTGQDIRYTTALASWEWLEEIMVVLLHFVKRQICDPFLQIP
jgi:hypothetical protein